jgi:methylated-DNA-[protein]-cysteine S-methyltransferase
MLTEKVYTLVKKIPKGKVTTYKSLAEKLNTKAYRAIGQILSKNKDHFLNNNKIPCHRVIKSNGELGGFLGEKTSKEKRKLLIKEGVEIKNNKIDLKKYLQEF